MRGERMTAAQREWNAERILRCAVRFNGTFMVERYSDRDASKRRALRKARNAGTVTAKRHGSSYYLVTPTEAGRRALEEADHGR